MMPSIGSDCWCCCPNFQRVAQDEFLPETKQKQKDTRKTRVQPSSLSTINTLRNVLPYYSKFHRHLLAFSYRHFRVPVFKLIIT